MANSQITTVKPSPLKCFIAGIPVFQVSLHYNISAKQDFTDGFSIMRHGLQGLGISDDQLFKHWIADTLPGFQFCLLSNR
jgi:hypothetical protein